MFAFDFANRKSVDLFMEIAKKQGVIVRASRYSFGLSIKVRPPLIVNESEIYEILDRLESSLIQFSKEREKCVL